MNDRDLVRLLADSAIFHDYKRAFSEATGMPLALRSVESWSLAHHGIRRQNPFCAMFAKSSPACGACLEAQRRTSDPAIHRPQSTECFAGLSEASVPVLVGERLIGFLQTGEVIVGKPSRQRFSRTERQLRDWGAKVDMHSLKEAYFQTTALTPLRFESVLRMLAIFAQHLGLVASQLAILVHHDEPAAIAKARRFIREHQTDELSLGAVAKAVNMSTFYFCKTFKKATGLTFTDYLSRSRVEKSMQLLANRHARISEVAYESGFQSLTHFNRSFHRVRGESPSEYRASLVK